MIWPRRMLLVLAATAAVLIGARAQMPASGSFRIAGRVINAVTGEPVRHAAVSALSEDNFQIVAASHTDNEGRFSFDGLPAGKYPLTASKRGFRTSYFDEHDNYNSAIVTGPDQNTTHLEFRLAPSAAIQGTVSDEAGDPAANANVRLYRKPPAFHPWEHITQVGAVNTDDSGAYEFSNLPAGDYLIAVEAVPWYALHPPIPRRAAGQNPLDVVYPITYFDSTTDEAAASPLTLAEGSRERADITLHPVPALRISFHLPTRADGTRPPMQILQSIFGQRSPVATGDNLNAEAGSEASVFAPGHYEIIQGDPPRAMELDATASVAVYPSGGMPAVSLTGTLRNSDGSAPTEGVMLVLDPLDNGPGQIQQRIGVPNGQFSFEALTAGRWTFSAFDNHGQDLPIVAVSTGGAFSAGNQIVVRDRPITATVVVSRTQTRVQGFARKNGKPASGVMVLLAPRDPKAYRALLRRDQSDSDGSFSFRQVPAGQYTVIAIEEGWKLNWQEPSVIARFLPGGVSVTVDERPDAIVSLQEAVPVSAP